MAKSNTITDHKELVWRITRHIQDMQNIWSYDGSEEFTDAEIDIHNSTISMGIVDQDWYDRRLKATWYELMCELIYVTGLHHMKENTKKIISEQNFSHER